MTPVHKLSRLFICSPLCLVPKNEEGWRRIHYLSYSRGESGNNHIPDGVGEMKYTHFQEVLQLIINMGRQCVIIKRDVKDAFRKALVAPQHC